MILWGQALCSISLRKHMRSCKISFSFLALLVCASISFSQPGIEWARVYNASDGNGSGGFFDIYLTARGDYALCGFKYLLGSRKWLMLANGQNGDELFNRTFQDSDVTNMFRSVIETDNGDILAGGYDNVVNNSVSIAAVRVGVDGRVIWQRHYGQEAHCMAVIELKAGDFMLAGGSAGDGYLVKIQGNGDVVWARTYGSPRTADGFNAIREVDRGYLLAGSSGHRAWLLRLDENGDEVQSRLYGIVNGQNRNDVFRTLISVPEGGFLAAGRSQWSVNLQPFSQILVDRVNDEGDVIWQRAYDPLPDGLCEDAWCAMNMPGSGFILVGKDAGRNKAIARRIESDGAPQWNYCISGNAQPIGASWFYSVVIDGDGGIIVAGNGHDDGRGVSGGIVMKLAPERLSPLIIEHIPEPSDLKIFPDDSIAFHIHAIDAQQDTLLYYYLLDSNIVSSDSDVVITFPNQGDFSVAGIAFDGQYTDSVMWNVTVRDLFIRSFLPDTTELTIRRGTTQDFSVDVATMPGDPVNYNWWLTDLTEQHDSLISDQANTSYQFLLSGDYRLSATAYRGESSDTTGWLIHVKSVVQAFWPRNLNLSAHPDTTINFGVLPFNQQSDSLHYLWLKNGVQFDTTSEVAISFPDSGIQSITAIVMDGSESDTLNWTVRVSQLQVVSEQVVSGIPTELTLYPPSPNPFNSSTTIAFSLPSASASASLRVYGLDGRLVQELLNGRLEAGEHRVIWNADLMPAGVYLVRLEGETGVKTVKAVMVK
jgi:hypothetical protein